MHATVWTSGRPLTPGSRAHLRELAPPSLEGEWIRLPGEIRDPECFHVDPGVTLDLTASTFLATAALAGLVRTARRYPVRLRCVPGPVLDKLRRIFWTKLRFSAGLWEIAL